MNEVWKPVVGYEGFYEVSNLGRVRSVDHVVKSAVSKTGKRLVVGKVLKAQFIKQCGYFYIQLNGERKKRRLSVHRLVAKAFIPNVDNKSDVNHVNGNKKDNRADNLEWVTASENAQHASIHGLLPHGENHKKSKLTIKDVKLIRLLSRFMTEKQQAKIFKVDRSRIGSIVRREAWKHVV